MLLHVNYILLSVPTDCKLKIMDQFSFTIPTMCLCLKNIFIYPKKEHIIPKNFQYIKKKNGKHDNLFTHVTPKSPEELVYMCTRISDRIVIWKCWFLRTAENRSTRRKTSRSKERTNNKLNPHMTPGLGMEPRIHWWEVSDLSLASPLLLYPQTPV